MHGVLLPGEGHVSATYEIDGDSHHTLHEKNNTRPVASNNETHFKSDKLALQRHHLVIDNINATAGRNYTLSSVVVSGSENVDEAKVSHRNIMVIIGIILGAPAFMLLLCLGAWRCQKRRSRRIAAKHSKSGSDIISSYSVDLKHGMYPYITLMH